MNPEYGLLVPKKSSLRTSKSGITPDFWSKDWDESIITKSDYEEAVGELKKQTQIVDQLPDIRDLYLEVKLKPKAKSKTSQPSRIWDDADLEVVDARDDFSVTLAGKKSEFLKLSARIKTADYEVAKNGGKDITKKEMNLYRELYAMSGIKNPNTDVKGRVDSYVLDCLANLTNIDPVSCIIELRSNIEKIRYDEIFDELAKNTEGEIQKRDPELFYANQNYAAKLLPAEIERLLTSPQFSYIRMIKRRPTYTDQRAPSSLNLDGVVVENPATSLTIAIVDSGVDSKFLNKLRTYHENHSSLPDDKGHGTFVASRAIFGHELTLIGRGGKRTLEPICKYVDIQVLGKKGIDKIGANDDQDIIKAIKSTIAKRPDIVLYNISFGEHHASDPAVLSDLTVALDTLSHKNDVLFVVSAGNQEAHLSLPYTDIFDHGNGHDIGIVAPGDSINSLTVGAVSYKVDKDSMTPSDYHPSPFTRMGKIRNQVKKPELVDDGGDFLSDTSLNDEDRARQSVDKYGVLGLKGDRLGRDIGTSFSAPLVTNQGVLALEYVEALNDNLMSDGNKSNLIRALLVHSTEFTTQLGKAAKHLELAYGAGIANFDNLFTGGEDRVTLVYADELDLSKKVHKLRFNIPKFLMTGGSKFTFTFAYNPPVDANYASQYNMVALQPSVRSILPPYFDKKKGKMVIDAAATIGRSKDWRNMWSSKGSLLHFVGTSRSSLPSDTVEFHIMATPHKTIEEKASKKKDKEAIKQKYAVVLSIEDRQKRGLLRQEIMNNNEFEVVSRARIQVAS